MTSSFPQTWQSSSTAGDDAAQQFSHAEEESEQKKRDEVKEEEGGIKRLHLFATPSSIHARSLTAASEHAGCWGRFSVQTLRSDRLASPPEPQVE